MARDDYHVIAYKILAYLYECLKSANPLDMDYLAYDTKAFPINEHYWNYVIIHLLSGGYIEGITLVPTLRGEMPGIKGIEHMQITPEGIEYLQNNSTMKKAQEFLKTVKEIVPGL